MKILYTACIVLQREKTWLSEHHVGESLKSVVGALVTLSIRIVRAQEMLLVSRSPVNYYFLKRYTLHENIATTDSIIWTFQALVLVIPHDLYRFSTRILHCGTTGE